MKFWSDSIKLDSPSESENFYFDLETPRGHFFSVLDFVPHDYANLDATLKLKLETIVGSFDSVPKFSTDLFLGFLAKEINNFLYELGKQSEGPQLFCSAALCLINGNRLVYFLCGDVKANVLDGGRLHPLVPARAAFPDSGVDAATEAGYHQLSDETERNEFDELGVRHWNAPLTGRLPACTLHDDEVILITTSGGEELFAQPEFSTTLPSLRLSDAKSICDAVMENSSASLAEMTLLVISGPYVPYLDPYLRDLSRSFDSLEARVDALAASGQRMGAAPDLIEKTFEAELEHRINPQIDELKDALSRKANTIDVLELNEILKNLGLVLANKADTTALLSLERDILKLGVDGKEKHAYGGNGIGQLTDGETTVGSMAEFGLEDPGLLETGDTVTGQDVLQVPRQTSFGLKTAVMVFIVAIGAAFVGAWLQSRILRKSPEVWSVKASGNQIWISRMDQGGQGNVSLNLSAPVKSQAEQTFSSFADVKSYLDTITGPQTSPDQTAVAAQTQTVPEQSTDTKMIAKADDSLKQSSHADKISPKKSSEVISTAGRKPESKTPGKISLNRPAAPSDATLKRDRRVLANSSANTTLVKVGAGDTLEKLARRFKTTSTELRKLNPQINERGVIRPQQKLVVPAPSSADDSKGRRLMVVKQAR